MAQSNSATKINIGDKAPEIRYGEWLKGTPVNQYEPGRLYVVEFWATWCGPCIAMMPHLSEFAKAHKDDATVIGVNIWEGSHGDQQDTTLYSTYLPKVSRFVKGMGDKMAYNVAMDNNDRAMSTNWMKAAGQEGIPCSFMIKDGIILWIGHPIDLDSVIKVVNSGSYDVNAIRKAAIEKEKAQAEMENKWKAVNDAYNEAVKQKDFKKAFQVLDSGIIKMPDMAGTFNFFKFQTLLENFPEDSAMRFVKEWRKMANPGYTGSVGAMICKKPGFKKDTYKYGIGLLKEIADGPNSIPPLMYDIIASGYANMGDYKTAVDIQTKVVSGAKQAMKDGKYPGFITEDSIKEYEKNLAAYKKQLTSKAKK